MINFKKRYVLLAIIVILLIALFATGCLSTSSSSGIDEKWEPPFEGIKWGMSEKEVTQILELSEEDFEKYNSGFTTEQVRLFGNIDGRLRFHFCERCDALTYIMAILSEGAANDTKNEFVSRLGDGVYYWQEFTDPETESIEEKLRRIREFESTYDVVWDSGLIQNQPRHYDEIKNIYKNWLDEKYDEEINEIEKIGNRSLVHIRLNLEETSAYPGEGIYYLEINSYYAAMVNEPDKFLIDQ